MNKIPLHKFHIPVLGLAYSIDTPIKVARYGISSVMSIIEDQLIEMMRAHYYPMIGLEYIPIPRHECNYRSKRITDYLNLVNRIVLDQVTKLRNATFESGSEIVKYFEMLPDDSMVKKIYLQMLNTTNLQEKSTLEDYLRTQIQPGSIDVNIMTKVDREQYNALGVLIEDGSDAVSALKAYADSDLFNSSVVFSAGMNPRLYNFLETCRAFDINENGSFTKKIIVKVSDYRSALIQGKYLAKKGIWISEFRIESGLNCGGHAFATDGYLIGPILEEFKQKKQELILSLFELYKPVQESKSGIKLTNPPPMIFSAQGGIGTSGEDAFLHQYYHIESTGWGTPFLLVPEATTVDESTLDLLSSSMEQDLVLSNNSPLGVRFYNLKGTTSEREKLMRINKGKPGSPCTEKHLAFNTEFTTDPICVASHKYQKLKIKQIQSLQLPTIEYNKQVKDVTDKECLCIGLCNSAAIKYKHTFVKKLNAVTICPGPNIVHFSKVVSLQTMVDHIYGRQNIITNAKRANMFINELNLYKAYLKEQLEEEILPDLLAKRSKYLTNFYQNLKNGIAYYHQLSDKFELKRIEFVNALIDIEFELSVLYSKYEMSI